MVSLVGVVTGITSEINGAWESLRMKASAPPTEVKLLVPAPVSKSAVPEKFPVV